MSKNSAELALGIKFKNKRLLQQALTHSSYAHERYKDKEKSNEKLEFLGDAVLSLVIVEELIKQFKNLKVGELARLKAYLVSEKTLSEIAEEINLGNYILLGQCEKNSKGYLKRSILANTFESVIGAYYLDRGYKKVKKFVIRLFQPRMEIITDAGSIKDYKSQLQEYIQEKFHTTPEYVLLKSEGPSHERIFTAGVKINGELMGVGKGKTRKEAEQIAASEALNKLLKENQNGNNSMYKTGS